MGISTDGAPKMIGSGGKSLCSRLQIDFPHMISVHDFCHALNLVILKSLKTFPADYEMIIKKILKTFSHAPEQNDMLERRLLRPYFIFMVAT